MIHKPGSPQRVVLELVKYRTFSWPYGRIRRIFMEGSTESDTKLLMLLKFNHGVILPENPVEKDKTIVHWIFDTQAKQALLEIGHGNPTWKLMLGFCRVFDLDRDRAIERFRQMIKGDEE